MLLAGDRLRETEAGVISDPHSRTLIGVLKQKDILEGYERRIVVAAGDDRSRGPAR